MAQPPPQKKKASERTLLVDFLERHGDVVAGSFECETLGRLAAASKRCLALNTGAGKLARRWLDAAEALDAAFPMADVTHFRGEWADWDVAGRDFCGGDPRYEIDATSLEDLGIKARVQWSATPAMTRVKTVVEWQRAVADAARSLPEDYEGVTDFVLRKRDARFADAYDFDGYPSDDDDETFVGDDGGDRCSDGMKLCLRLAYLACCEIDRCTEFGDSHAGDVYVNGWDDCGDFRDRCFFDDVLTGELFEKQPGDASSSSDDDDDAAAARRQKLDRRAWRRAHAISTHKAWFLSQMHTSFYAKLAAFLGSRVSRDLAVCRGDLLPPNWRDLFDDDNSDDDNSDDDPLGQAPVAFLELLMLEIWRYKSRSLSENEKTNLASVLIAKWRQNPRVYHNTLYRRGPPPIEFLKANFSRDELPSVFAHLDAPDDPQPPSIFDYD